MTVLWIIFSFAAGWIACWYFAKWAAHVVLRRPKGATATQLVATMEQESLLNLRDSIANELKKRMAA